MGEELQEGGNVARTRERETREGGAVVAFAPHDHPDTTGPHLPEGILIGLVVPHAIRLLWGHTHRLLLPAAFLLGGALLAGADALARTAFAPLTLPVGVVTAILGVPVFAVLVRRWAT